MVCPGHGTLAWPIVEAEPVSESALNTSVSGALIQAWRHREWEVRQDLQKDITKCPWSKAPSYLTLICFVLSACVHGHISNRGYVLLEDCALNLMETHSMGFIFLNVVSLDVSSFPSPLA